MLHTHNTIENRNDLIDNTMTKLESIYGKVIFFFSLNRKIFYMYVKGYKNIYNKNLNLSC